MSQESKCDPSEELAALLKRNEEWMSNVMSQVAEAQRVTSEGTTCRRIFIAWSSSLTTVLVAFSKQLALMREQAEQSTPNKPASVNPGEVCSVVMSVR